jgi:hypothetical protein
MCIPLVLRVRAVIEGWDYGWVGGSVLGYGFFCRGRSRWMCVLLGCGLGGLGCRGFSPGLCGDGVGVPWAGKEVGGDWRVGFHALHSRMLSYVEGAKFLFRLIWVRIFFSSPRVWAGGLSVAMCFVLGGVDEVAGVWVGCGSILCRLGGRAGSVCGERGAGELFDLGLGCLEVWVCRVWGCYVVCVGFR